jgi:hypothetical protein
MSDKEWLQNLKVGDAVIVEGTGLSSGESLGTVARLTKNFIVVNSNGFDSKFRNETGWSTGDSYYHKYLKEATPEAIAAFEEERYRAVFKNKLSHLSWADVPIDRIKQIRELVEPYLKRKEEKI